MLTKNPMRITVPRSFATRAARLRRRPLQVICRPSGKTRRSGLVPVDVPMEIARGRFVDGGGDGREVGSDVMLEAAFANEVQ